MQKCTMCNQQASNHFGPENTCIQPTGGLHIAIYTGYGMMADLLDETSHKALSSICLCHDCSIKLIDMFPQEFKDNFFTGGHPISICRQHSETHPNGCHYAWA